MPERVGTVLPDWVEPGAPPGPAELVLPIAEGAAVLAAFVRVVGMLAGETEVAVGTPDGLLTVVLPDGSWRDLAAAVEGAPVRPLDGPVDARFGPGPAALAVTVDGDRLRLRRDPARFDAGWAERVAGYLAAALAADPDTPHARADLLDPAERDRLVHGLSGAERELPGTDLPRLLAARAAERPAAPAVTYEGGTWTYARLQEAVERVADGLVAAGVRAEDVVAVSCPRSPEWATGLLGVLRAGGAFLPVEPGTPADRVADVLRQSGSRYVLTGSDGLPGTGDAWCRPVAALLGAAPTPAPAPAPAPAPRPGIGPDRLAYLYFTSGSTGRPKGAMVEHGGLLNHLQAKIEDLGLTDRDVVVQSAPQSFDISLWQFAAPLLVGARVLVVSREDVLDARRFLAAVADATVMQVVPSYLDVLLRHLEDHPGGLSRLRLVSVTGEAIGRSLVARWFDRFPTVPLVNAYGATEAADDATHAVLTAPPAGDVPVGRPLRNTTVYVLGPGDTLRPLGAPGEIAFSGVGVGRGYVNDPERTAAAFGPDPFRPGQRLYRTGDVGRWLPSGQLAFAGRRDDQVKVNGMRIELGEVEHALLRHPRVRAAAVVAAALPGVGTALVGFYVAPDGLPGAELREHLAALLPASSLPAGLHRVDVLPLTGNGKVDKRALAATATAGPAAAAPGGPPRTPTERRLAKAWAAALDRPVASISREASFFDLGGGSLSALQMVGRLDGWLSLADLVRTPVLSELAAAVDAR